MNRLRGRPVMVPRPMSAEFSYADLVQRLVDLDRLMWAPPVGERPMLTFEPLTLAPIDRACIEPALLTAEEAAQLNAYHSRVLETVGPLVSGDVRQWLKAACAPL